ncbi:hypothetical protein PENSPDRAFT_690646 [Peniophora sp. CONT]|nr:hypothetical protein PENSPDRAFT_690646 [Peniophora sp. CONT]
MAPHPKLSARARQELESQANAHFRSVVRRRANRIKLGLIAQLRAQCARMGVELIGPRLQYRADDPNRGRYYVVSSAPFPGHRRKMFRYVSDPISALALQELEDARIARELQDEGLRPIRLGISRIPLGNASFLLGLGLDARHIPRSLVRSTVAPRHRTTMRENLRGRTRSQAPTAPPVSRVRPARADSSRRERSPSIEIIDAVVPAPHIDLTSEPSFLKVLYYPALRAAPVELLLEQSFPGAPYRFAAYASQWNAIETKLTDPVMLLIRAEHASTPWHVGTLGDFSFPPCTRRVIVARRTFQLDIVDNIEQLHPSLHYRHSWAYGGSVLTFPIVIE